MRVSISLSTVVHGLVVTLAVFGLPSLINAPLELEAPIAVTIITPDNAVGFMAPDVAPNIWPGDTADETGEGLAAPEGDDEDAPSSEAAAAPESAPARALDGTPNDVEGRDAQPQGEMPGIALVG